MSNVQEKGKKSEWVLLQLSNTVSLFYYFIGKSLNAFGGSTFKLNPEINEAFELRGWFDQQGHSTNFQSHTSDFKAGGNAPRMTCEEFKTQAANLNPTEQLTFEVKATIVMMAKTDSTFQYAACPTKGCNKKVMEDTNSQWRCERCNQSFPEPEYRYVMGVNVGDHTSTAWIQAFNEAGQTITGRTAYDLVTVSIYYFYLFVFVVSWI